ncbi:fumarylacetoacetate hydrolase family protein [Paraglaciecola aquimarina]|uniref:Fumarylacetoacetate hydrolase family protein n=1 Tax=Paraglaciecola algarum TaxID=3050085 RepID=A0ABS9DA68_9ALTE|nr:fumarylacetoacetate hydrolase family protein [Paraglaciecola sp. G1-23]MCF2949776.1 fumarylacetoacetate hydrolase family protein [Paraglaciecola sp. G1-23]
MRYEHTDQSGNKIDLPVGKVVCVGRNYMLHIQELNNEVPKQPLLFMKPATALCPVTENVVIPKNLGECHNELEVAVLINQKLTSATAAQALTAIWGVGLGLDLTLRDVQSQLKNKGQPWERAKAFDDSCPMSHFIPLDQIKNLTDIDFKLTVNGETRQEGNTRDMMFPILELIIDITKQFTLLPGDIVMTGTPKGVAALKTGEQLTLELTDKFTVTTQII